MSTPTKLQRLARIVGRAVTLAQTFLPSWSWRIDGVLAAIIITAICAAHFVPSAMFTLYLNGFALFALGFMLKRNLRRDTSWKDLRDAIRTKADSQRRTLK